jgi:hypothetical protein
LVGVDDLPELDGELEERHEHRPDRPPRLDHRRVDLLPLAGELGEAGLGRLDRRAA